MRKRTVLLLLAAAVLVLAGCAGQQPVPESEYVLYFLTDDSRHHGPALTAQPWPLEEGVTPTPGELLDALAEGPTQDGLESPFPRGVTVRGWEWDEQEPGKIRVQMSEGYSGLTDIALTLADYSIVLTLTQLESVESVEIQTALYSANYRSHQTLLPEEAVLSDALAR